MSQRKRFYFIFSKCLKLLTIEKYFKNYDFLLYASKFLTKAIKPLKIIITKKFMKIWISSKHDTRIKYKLQFEIQRIICI